MKYIITTLVIIFICILLAIPAIIAYSTDEYVKITIKEKERITDGSGQNMVSKYLVFTDGEVFENTDSVWYWKWNSSDVYNELAQGKEYTARVYGYRVPFLSWYRNIITIN